MLGWWLAKKLLYFYMYSTCTCYSCQVAWGDFFLPVRQPPPSGCHFPYSVHVFQLVTQWGPSHSVTICNASGWLFWDILQLLVSWDLKCIQIRVVEPRDGVRGAPCSVCTFQFLLLKLLLDTKLRLIKREVCITFAWPLAKCSHQNKCWHCLCDGCCVIAVLFCFLLLCMLRTAMEEKKGTDKYKKAIESS